MNRFYKITIPNPCTENWDDMQPTEKGKYCLACNKNVIDFRSMANNDVQHYFAMHQGEKICGRLRQSQLDNIKIYIPHHIFQKRIPAWKKYLLLLLICFGSQLFSVDVMLGGHYNLYAQTTSHKIKNKKKRKRLAKPFYKEWFINLPRVGASEMEVEIMGFTVAARYFEEFAVPAFPNLNKATQQSGISIQNESSQHENKPYQPKEASAKTAFTLPTPITFRKRIRKSKS